MYVNTEFTYIGITENMKQHEITYNQFGYRPFHRVGSSMQPRFDPIRLHIGF